jgi:hypothetical protein
MTSSDFNGSNSNPNVVWESEETVVQFGFPWACCDAAEVPIASIVTAVTAKASQARNPLHPGL